MTGMTTFRTCVEQNVLVIEVLHAVSSLTDSIVLQELDQVRKQMRNENHHAVVIDLGAATYFGSSLLEAIRVLGNDLHACSGKLALCNATDVGLEVLGIVKFDRIWPITQSRAEAIRLVTA